MSKTLDARAERNSANHISPLPLSRYPTQVHGSSTILVACDYPLVVEGIRSLIARMGLGADALYASNIETALRMLRENSVDLMLLDLYFGDSARMDMLARVREYDAAVPVIVLSACESSRAIRGAIDAGASGFVLETAPLDFLMHAISVALSGERLALVPLDSMASERDTDEEPAAFSAMRNELRDRYIKLTAREGRVLSHIREGMSNKEIARMLGIFEGTVKVHVKSILRKLNAKNRTVAALMAAAMADA